MYRKEQVATPLESGRTAKVAPTNRLSSTRGTIAGVALATTSLTTRFFNSPIGDNRRISDPLCKVTPGNAVEEVFWRQKKQGRSLPMGAASISIGQILDIIVAALVLRRRCRPPNIPRQRYRRHSRHRHRNHQHCHCGSWPAAGHR
jgi:hypothetical protein